VGRADEAKIGLVLSGGGARGAYEAGIIQFLCEAVPARLGRPLRVDFITGTSVGAINACFLAATADDTASQGTRLVDNWKSLRIEEMISLQAKDLFKGVLGAVGRVGKIEPGQFRYGGLLQTDGLEQFVFRHIPWRCIHRNLRDRHIDGLAVAATRVGTGHTVVFVETRKEAPLSWSRNPLVRGVATHIGPRHALASAAIPGLFPAVKIQGRFYTDGGLRMNTPLSPAIRLGATRLLVVSLKHKSDADMAADAERVSEDILEAEREQALPKPMYIAGKALNALLLDHTEYDIERMERLNVIMEAGERAFGAQFVTMLNDEITRLRGAPLRRLAVEQLRPSVDIGVIMSDFLRNRRYQVEGRTARYLLDQIADAEAAHESDLMSYLLFDGNYAAELIELGYKDAKRREEQLLRFFDVDAATAGEERADADAV